jgi:hypothetical protein
VEKCLTRENSHNLHLSGTIQLVKKLALTLTLYPRRGNRPTPRLEESPSGGLCLTLTIIHPLLGERAGVRENFQSQLNGPGLFIGGGREEGGLLGMLGQLRMAYSL